MSKFSLLVLPLTLLLLTRTPVSESRDRHVIKFRSPGLYPESLTWDPSSQHFILPSLTRGTFHSLTDAAVTEPLTSPTPLPPNSTTLGATVDHRNNRLLAAVNTAGAAYLATFSLLRTSLSLLSLTPLPSATSSPPPLANDVAVDPHGNAYVTNSNHDVIWKVTLDGAVSLLSNSSLFKSYPHADPTSEYNYCGLNGVVYVPGKEYLLVVQSNTGMMYKVDVHDGAVRTVGLDEVLFLADGIAVREDGVVVVVSMNWAWFLKSDDNWARAVVIDKIALDKEGFASGVSVGGGGRVYVLYGYVQESTKGNAEGGEREWFRVEELRIESENDVNSLWLFISIGLGFGYFVFWRFQMARLGKSMDKKRN